MLKFFTLEPGFKLFFLEAKNQQPEKWSTESEYGAIQFHFCLSGEAMYGFNNNTYRMPLKADHVLLLYHPNHTLPAKIIAHRGAKIFSVFISIKKFHALFSDNTYHIPFLSDELKGKKYYHLQDFNLSVQMVLQQLFNNVVHEDLKH
ncbi:MAG: AraC family transcriptional regulator, partial [Flavobacteriaceae bacterium]|nr:AraC family transcriptional regulator [Flavobacteriaceae bacterium]